MINDVGNSNSFLHQESCCALHSLSLTYLQRATTQREERRVWGSQPTKKYQIISYQEPKLSYPRKWYELWFTAVMRNLTLCFILFWGEVYQGVLSSVLRERGWGYAGLTSAMPTWHRPNTCSSTSPGMDIYLFVTWVLRGLFVFFPLPRLMC